MRVVCTDHRSCPDEHCKAVWLRARTASHLTVPCVGRGVIDVATPTHASSMSPKEALSILPDREVQCATYYSGNFW